MTKDTIKDIQSCPCCGSNSFYSADILWPELIKDWELRADEVAYTNKQQALRCEICNANLRSMSLASAIMRNYHYRGPFRSFVKKYSRKLSVLEVNEAGDLSQSLSMIKKHTLGSYPAVDVQHLPYASESFDLVVHSDTLEHVKDPVLGLREIYRVLKPNGITCYTIPIIIGRLSKSREGMKASYHGSPGNDEYKVMTEYGADMWTEVMKAGFGECRLYSIDFPASIVITAIK